MAESLLLAWAAEHNLRDPHDPAAASHEGEFPAQEMHDYLSSLPPGDVTAIASAIRRHLSMENGCHYLLDVTHHKDHNQVRDRTCAQNLTLYREISAELLRDYPLKGSIRSKRKRAAFSSVFRIQIVDPIFNKPHA